VVLLPAGAFAVHQLRYWLTYGSQASNQLTDQGHAYLGPAVPWLIMGAAAGLGLFVARTARSARSGGLPTRLLPLWGVTGVALLAIYSLQEFLEGLFAAGHPGGLTGIYGHGGWWAVPAAAAVALAIALLLRVTETLVRRAVADAATPQMRRASTRPAFPASLRAPRRRPLAAAAAGRAPPRALSVA